LTSNQLLVDLARSDARLFQLKQQITALPRRLLELDRERAHLARQQREAEARWEQVESARRKLESELAEFRAKRSKSEARLAALTSTEQYLAVQKEIATHAERIDALESSILEALERSEEMRRQRDAEAARVAQELHGLEAQQAQLRADLAAAQGCIPAETAQRDAAVAAIDAPTRVLYERILRAKGDAAVALLHGTNCGICKGVQPPQIVALLRQGRGSHSCQMCGRILVWDPESA
jgi:predicted  nucleic acid-binding Zn-ribbon protein